jgi:2-dehydropantoate 2-reductase
MKFGILGSGATGGYLGAKLTRSGANVTMIVREPQLTVMRSNGLRLIEQESGADFVTHPCCTDDLNALRDVDIVFLTLKAYSITAVAESLAGILTGDTAIVTAQNGIPWWYFHKLPGKHEDLQIRALDPEGLLRRTFSPERIIGCVVWPATRRIAPGIIEHIEGTRFTIGELDGARSERCRDIAAALQGAGLKCPVSAHIRREMWLKLLGNVAVNPISALTGATLNEIVAYPATHALARSIMEEADSVARALGVDVPLGIELRLAGAGNVGDHKTSMLQDLEAKRPTEIEALAGAVLELSDLVGLALPHLRAVYACVKLLEGRSSG